MLIRNLFATPVAFIEEKRSPENRWFIEDLFTLEVGCEEIQNILDSPIQDYFLYDEDYNPVQPLSLFTKQIEKEA